jgi:hypothetical protein
MVARGPLKCEGIDFRSMNSLAQVRQHWVVDLWDCLMLGPCINHSKLVTYLHFMRHKTTLLYNQCKCHDKSNAVDLLPGVVATHTVGAIGCCPYFRNLLNLYN